MRTLLRTTTALCVLYTVGAAVGYASSGTNFHITFSGCTFDEQKKATTFVEGLQDIPDTDPPSASSECMDCEELMFESGIPDCRLTCNPITNNIQFFVEVGTQPPKEITRSRVTDNMCHYDYYPGAGPMGTVLKCATSTKLTRVSCSYKTCP